jgi:hypothetical protein
MMKRYATLTNVSSSVITSVQLNATGEKKLGGDMNEKLVPFCLCVK